MYNCKRRRITQKHTTFRTQRKFEIKNTSPLWEGNCIKTDGAVCTETSAYKIQTPVNYPEESIQKFKTRRKFEIKNTSPLWRGDSNEDLHQVFEDGTDRGFRNVGKSQSDAGEIPKRIHTNASLLLQK
jgi:hypothetical protein